MTLLPSYLGGRLVWLQTVLFSVNPGLQKMFKTTYVMFGGWFWEPAKKVGLLPIRRPIFYQICKSRPANKEERLPYKPSTQE
jgi:hypothetical protein